MPQTRKSLAGGPGNLEKASNSQADFTEFLRTVQQVYPCASCGYLRLVARPDGGFRKACTLTADNIGKHGKPACEFIKAGAHE